MCWAADGADEEAEDINEQLGAAAEDQQRDEEGRDLGTLPQDDRKPDPGELGGGS